MNRTIAAHTEPRLVPDGQVVAYVNVSAVGAGGRRVTLRNRDGVSASIDLTPAEWARFKAGIIDGDAAPYLTGYELRWGADGGPEQKRYFTADNMVDAAVRLSERIFYLDSDEKVGGAYVSLAQLPSGRQMIWWTKCSNERPTSEGALEPPESSIAGAREDGICAA